MNISGENLKGLSGSTPTPPIYINRALFSWAFVFTLVLLLTFESKVILHFARNSAGPGFGSYGLFMTLGMPLIVAVLAVGAYLNVKRVVSTVSEDPAILRAITFYGLMVLGFAFLTMDLIL